MSGNPFRRNVVAGHGEDSRSDERAISPPRAQVKKKRVVIQTPPHSPEEPPRRPSTGRLSPPPPLSALSGDDSDSDSNATADPELEQASLNTRRNSGSLPVPSVDTMGSGAPYNPFAKTLATSEASFGLQSSRNDQQEANIQDTQSQSRSAAPKTAKDVDAFKSMLLAGGPVPDPARSTTSRRPQNLNNAPNTSFVSRSSLFDHLHDPHPESPLTAGFDHHEYSSSEDDDDENSGLMGTTGERLDDFPPPAPPKPGQMNTPRGPQTVSFADFDQAIPSPYTSTSSRGPLDGSALDISPLQRSLSDLNKPLPAPPRDLIAPTIAKDVEQTQQTASVSSTRENSVQERKAPPPPPTSRRTGQSSQGQSRTRSTSNLSQESDFKDAPSQSKAGAPPPPPSRKSKSTPALPSPATEAQADVVSSPSTPSEPRTMPPPPAPRRAPARPAGSLHRTPSSASHSSIPRPDSAANTSQTTPPPAPPPRRGANQKRDSFEAGPNSMAWAARRTSTSGRRSSGASIDSTRSAPLPKFQPALAQPVSNAEVAPTSNGTAERDILADMSAFQAEIDALRSQAEKNG